MHNYLNLRKQFHGFEVETTLFFIFKKKTIMLPKKTNAVNSIVSDLIRAAAGSSAKNVSDQDVDKYVADLILKEAEEKRKKYNDIGVKAYQPITYVFLTWFVFVTIDVNVILDLPAKSPSQILDSYSTW